MNLRGHPTEQPHPKESNEGVELSSRKYRVYFEGKKMDLWKVLLNMIKRVFPQGIYSQQGTAQTRLANAKEEEGNPQIACNAKPMPQTDDHHRLPRIQMLVSTNHSTPTNPSPALKSTPSSY